MRLAAPLCRVGSVPRTSLTRKQMTEFEAVGVCENASHPPSEKRANRPTIPAQAGSGKRKDEVLGELSADRKLSRKVTNQAVKSC